VAYYRTNNSYIKVGLLRSVKV